MTLYYEHWMTSFFPPRPTPFWDWEASGPLQESPPRSVNAKLSEGTRRQSPAANKQSQEPVLTLKQNKVLAETRQNTEFTNAP